MTLRASSQLPQPSATDTLALRRVLPSVGTTGTLHCVAVKQAARLLELDVVDDRIQLRVRFAHAAEYVRVGTRAIFRDGSSGAEQLCLSVGVVTSCKSS